MAAPLQPSIRFTLRLEKYPASEGTTVYRWSTRPLADEGAWTEGRVISFGAIERALSTPDGDWDIAQSDVMVDDSDGLIRGLLAGQTTRYFTSREAALELLSEAGRAAGTAWRTLFRGRVSDAQAVLGRKAKIRISDEVGSHFSGFDLDKMLGVPITRAEHPNLPEGNVNRIYPYIIGEHSDFGAVDANGNPADKGMLPVIDTGDYLLNPSGTTVDGPSPYLSAPSSVSAVVNGTPGESTLTYTVTALSPYGETTASEAEEVTTAPVTLNGTNYITLSWGAVEGAIEYRVYRNGRLIVRLNNAETYTDPETTWDDDGTETVGASTPPQTNGAFVDYVLNGDTVSGWARMILKLGAAAEVQNIYGSDLAVEGTPKRIRLPESVYGSEVLVYGRPGWPLANPYIEINGIRMGVMYARGPRLDHHRRGIVTFAWNGCGDDDIGDGTGETIDEAFPALQHFLNEYVLKNEGEGYLTGTYGPLEEYSNGVEKLKSSAFTACQALTVTWIGDRGYLASIAITQAISLREFLRRFFVTFACLGGTDHHGQVYPVLIDDTADPTVGRHYRDRIEIHKLVSQDIDHDAVETRVIFHYDWDADAQEFRSTDNVIEDTAASEAHKGVRQRGDRQCYYTRDKPTAHDSNARHLARFKVAPRYLGFETDLTGLEDENGAQIRVTHYDGAGGVNGDEATPFLVVKHKAEPNPSEATVLTGFDLLPLLIRKFGRLQDETVMDGNLFDETVFAPPPAGALRL